MGVGNFLDYIKFDMVPSILLLRATRENLNIFD